MSTSLFWLLKAAPPQRWERLVPALGEHLDRLAGFAHRLPPGLVDAIVATGRATVVDRMVSSVGRSTDAHADLRRRLAQTGRADMAVGATYHWPWPDLRTMFAAARPDDPAWTGPNGAVTLLLASEDVDSLRPAVVGPFPALVRHALRVAGTRMTRAEQLRGLLSIATVAGPDGLADLHGFLSPRVADDLAAVLAGLADLAGLVAAAEATPGAVEELRSAPSAEQLSLRTRLDWALILAAHHDDPFDDRAATLLAARADCPEPVLVALFASHPLAVAKVAAPTPALLAAPLPATGAAAVAKARADAAVKAGLPADALLRAVPAPVVLEALHRHKALPDELRELVAARLGTDVGRWRWVRAALRKHRGSTVELLDSCPPGPPPGPWPEAKAMPGVADRKAPTGVRAAFVALLDAAPVAAHLALFGHLDGHTVYDLLSRGRWRDEWVEVALASTDPALRRSLSTRRDLDAAVLERLATCADPVVDDQLFRADNLPWELRTRILSRPVPLDPALRSHLLSYLGGSGASPFYARDAIDCADLDVQLHIPRYRLVYGEVPQLRLVVNLWRRHGRAAVEKLLAVTDGPSTFQGRLLSAGTIRRVRRCLDGDGGSPDSLEDEVTRGEAVSVQLALLHEAGGPASARLRECHDWRWGAIRDEHAVRPFRDDVLAALAARPGCPEWFRDAFGSVLLAGLSRGERPAHLLTRLEVEPHTLTWLVTTGKLTWADVFAHARPAEHALEALFGAHDGLAALRALIESTVDGEPDAWALAAHMLPGFAGSVSDLLHTATAATG